MLDLLVPLAILAPFAALAARWRPAAAVGLVAAVVGTWRLADARAFALLAPVVDRVDAEAPVVALTFDDGPTEAYTDPVLDRLAVAGARATFFVTGRELAAHPELGRRILAAGHELGDHSWSHERMVLRSTGWIADELDRTDAVLRSVGADAPLFRPPYGKKLLALGWVLRRSGRTAVTWDVEPESDPAVAASADAIAAHVLERVRPGSIVLLHVMYGARETSREALPAILEGLGARGYRFVTVSELLAHRGGR